MKTNKNKTADSKNKYGTMTAGADANNDYTSSTSSSASSSSASSITAQSMSEYGTMTALEYTNMNSNAKEPTAKKSAPQKGSLTSSYDSNQQS